MLPPGAAATIRFQAAVAHEQLGGRLIPRADLTDDRGRLVSAWGEMYVSARMYLPLVWRGG